MVDSLWSKRGVEKAIQTVSTPMADLGGWISLGSTATGLALNSTGASSYVPISSAIATGLGGLIYVFFGNLVGGYEI